MFSKIKKFGLAVLLITAVGVFSANAQNSNPKVIALLTKASWCPVCKANGPRFKKDIMPMVMKNKDVKMVAIDMTNDKTIASSKKMLEMAGVPMSFLKTHKATGLLYFLDADSKKVITVVSIANPDMQIKMAFKEAMKMASK